MVAGPEEGLAWIAALEARERLEDYYLLPAARADLLRRAGRNAEAAADYRRAMTLTSNAAERNYLERRMREVPQASSHSDWPRTNANAQPRWEVGRLTYRALAMTYFLTGNPQYHRRGVVSRSCSGWEGVGPTRYGRQEFWNREGSQYWI